MKLCPLFESIPSLNAAKNGTAIALNAVYQEGIAAANKVLPREAIEAAIVAMQQCDEARDYPTRELYADYIEQLRAMLPDS